MVLCIPAQIYLALSVIAILAGLFIKCQYSVLIVKIIWVWLWTYLLNFLCSKGYGTISWILVLLPFVLIAFTILIISEVSRYNKNNKIKQ
jgi:hypothetical protein